MSSSSYQNIVVAHYSRREVQEEIAKFSKSRWVALHCEKQNASGRPFLLRYRRTRKTKEPLTINTPDDIPALLKRFEKLRPRTFYASASVYKSLASPEHVRSLDNIAFCLPTWDIDNVIDKWEATIAVSKEIVNFLDKEGVSKSVFLKWSGNGAHVHIHEKAFSPELLRKINPLDIAYAIVEYVNSKLRSQYLEIAEQYGAKELKIENEMDPQRVFTCPLSLHRGLDIVAVCFSPDTVDSFYLDWVSVERYRHWTGWDKFETGEADSLAQKAYQAVGAYPLRKFPMPRKQRGRSAAEMITKWLRREKDEVR